MSTPPDTLKTILNMLDQQHERLLVVEIGARKFEVELREIRDVVVGIKQRQDQYHEELRADVRAALFDVGRSYVNKKNVSMVIGAGVAFVNVVQVIARLLT